MIAIFDFHTEMVDDLLSSLQEHEEHSTTPYAQDLIVQSPKHYYFQQFIRLPQGLQIAIKNLQQALSGRTVYGIHQSWTQFPLMHRLPPIEYHAFGSQSFSSPIHNVVSFLSNNPCMYFFK